MKRWGQNLILIFISSAVAIGLAELSIRLLVPKERWQFRDSSVDWQPDSLLGWRQKINYKATNYDLGPVPIVFETNADGFRPKTAVPASVSDSSLVVFLVGNSTVNGRHVSERETIHYWLDSLLTSRGKKPVVVNASVQGYSTDQALLMIRRYARQYKPDWIIYGFCDNDLGGIVSQQAYGLNKPMFARQGDSTKLIPMTRYNEDFAAFRSRSWKDPIVNSAIYRMARPIFISMAARNADPAKQILVGANSADYYFEPERLDAFDWMLLDALITEMKAESARLGAQTAVYTHPAVESVWLPHVEAAEKKRGKKIDPFVLEERLASIARREDLTFVPMASYFRANQSRGPFHLLPKDTHCNGRGYQLQAECLSAVITQASVK